MSEEFARALGRLEGKIDQVLKKQDKQDKRFDGLDKRLRSVEQRSAIWGAVGGAISLVSLKISAVLSGGSHG